jgi:hypothetical protein
MDNVLDLKQSGNYVERRCSGRVWPHSGTCIQSILQAVVAQGHNKVVSVAIRILPIIQRGDDVFVQTIGECRADLHFAV